MRRLGLGGTDVLWELAPEDGWRAVDWIGIRLESLLKSVYSSSLAMSTDIDHRGNHILYICIMNSNLLGSRI